MECRVTGLEIREGSGIRVQEQGNWEQETEEQRDKERTTNHRSKTASQSPPISEPENLYFRPSQTMVVSKTRSPKR